MKLYIIPSHIQLKDRYYKIHKCNETRALKSLYFNGERFIDDYLSGIDTKRYKTARQAISELSKRFKRKLCNDKHPNFRHWEELNRCKCGLYYSYRFEVE
jgi:hypothetical protein